jgi:UPF0042 nucleotide-binding protein
MASDAQATVPADDEVPALTDLVIITGFSGAGKSTAMAAFEDEGYFCVDNLPSEMIRSLVDLFMHTGSKVAKAAVVSDVRGGSYFEGLSETLDHLRAAGVQHRVLFLESDEQTLLTRYKETRRRHPLAPRGSVADGIARERKLLAPLRARADTPAGWRSPSRALASNGGRLVTPTCCSTSASSPTPTTSPSCGR